MSKETELVIFCKVGNFEGFREAIRAEEHEQLELPIEGKGTVRVRKTTDKDGTRFEACVKTTKKQEGAADVCEETEVLVTSQYMETFRNLADNLKLKTRYIFDGTKSIITLEEENMSLPPVKYEVDVYKRFDGKISDWCKIDIELDDFMKALKGIKGLAGKDLELITKVTHLPFKPQRAFISGACSDEEKILMKKLWDTEFTQNPFGGPRIPVVSNISKDSNPSQQPEVKPTTEADNERSDNSV